MKKNSPKQWRCCQPGLTLIEVVAGIALLGTVLVAVLLTEAKCKGQSRGAKVRLAACRAAEKLLEEWWATPEDFPREGQGELSEETGFLWRTYVCRNEAAEELGGEAVRLEIRSQGFAAAEKPVVTVDVVLPIQEDQNEAGVHAD